MIGVISIASAAIYVSMMALYYAGILKSQKEFEDEARRHLDTSNNLREAVAKAERAGAAKAEFLARTSHELRTPLNAVIGFSEVLLEETDPEDDQQGVEDLKKIHGAGMHLLSLVNAILDISKIEAGRMEVFPDRHCLNQLLAGAVQRSKASSHSVSIVTSVDPEVDDIETDATKLEQVLLLLIKNAVEFAGEGVVAIAARATRLASGERGVEITVSDRGRGIDRTLLPTLFETFSEGQDLKHSQKGPGLGLPLSRRLCRLLRGDLRVGDTGPAGTTMTIELPCYFSVTALAA